MPDNHQEDNILELICSHQKFERDKGISSLERITKKWFDEKDTEAGSLNENERKKFQEKIISLLEETPRSKSFDSSASKIEIDHSYWEMKQGLLSSLHLLIEIADLGSNDDLIFLTKTQEIVSELISDEEARVRETAGEVLGQLSKKVGSSVYLDSKEKIVNLLISSLEKLANHSDSFDVNVEEVKMPVVEVEVIKDFGTKSEMKEKIFHETAGYRDAETHEHWRNETMAKTLLKCLQSIIENMKESFVQFIDTTLMDLIFSTLSHENRFVKEYGFYLISSLVDCGPLEKNPFGNLIAEKISEGLTEKWIQVRLASSFAARNFLLTNVETREEYFPLLLPRLCLNRYYIAEGVRIYSQESWKLIMKNEGRVMVAKYAPNIIDYYLSASKNEDKFTREATSSCISELAQKIDPEAISPFVPKLIWALVPRFNDHFWPARDSACLACGNIILNYPEESKKELDQLNELFFKALGDPIPSIRQGAAASLANVVRAYKSEVLNFIFGKIKEGLISIEEQTGVEIESEKSDRQSPIYDPDVEDQHIHLSVGSSLSLTKRRSSGATILLDKKPQPFFLTDGALYLVGEISEIDICKPYLTDFIPLILKATQVRHFKEHLFVLESFCKIIPLLAKGLEKKVLKSHLNSFFEPIFYSIESKNALTSMAGQNCLQEIGNLVGKTIMKSRIELYDPKYVVYYTIEADHEN